MVKLMDWPWNAILANFKTAILQGKIESFNNSKGILNGFYVVLYRKRTVFLILRTSYLYDFSTNLEIQIKDFFSTLRTWEPIQVLIYSINLYLKQVFLIYLDLVRFSKEFDRSQPWNVNEKNFAIFLGSGSNFICME